MLTLYLLNLPSTSALYASATIDLADAQHCDLPPDLPVCPVGHDPGSEPGVGDDSVYISTLINRVDIDVDVGFLIPPISFGVGDGQPLEYPLFRQVEDTLMLVDSLVPEPLHEFVDVQNGTTSDGDEGWWVRICTPAVPGLEEFTPLCRYIPFIYNPDWIERDRFYPLPRLSESDYGSDDIIDDSAEHLGHCLYELEQVNPYPCRIKNETLHRAADVAKALLPAVFWDAGIEEVDGDLGGNDTAAAGRVWHASGGVPGTSSSEPGVPGQVLRPAGAVPLLRDAPAWSPSPRAPAPSASPHDRAPPPDSEAASVPPRPVAAPWMVPVVAAAALLPLAWFLYHRIAKERVLNHRSRQQLLAIITAQPGLRIGDAARQLGVNYHTMAHHVDVLRRSGRIEVRRVGRFRALYPAGDPGRVHHEAVAHLRRGPQAEALRVLRGAPEGLGVSELAAVLGCAKSSAHTKLRRMAGQGLVERCGGGRYRATLDGEAALAQLERGGSATSAGAPGTAAPPQAANPV